MWISMSFSVANATIRQRKSGPACINWSKACVTATAPRSDFGVQRIARARLVQEVAVAQKATPDGTMRRFVTEQSLQIWAAKGGTWGEGSAARPVECAKSQKRRPLSRGDPD